MGTTGENPVVSTRTWIAHQMIALGEIDRPVEKGNPVPLLSADLPGPLNRRRGDGEMFNIQRA